MLKSLKKMASEPAVSSNQLQVAGGEAVQQIPATENLDQRSMVLEMSKKNPEKTKTDSAELERRRKMTPNVPHPVVRIHPVTGRKCLYVTTGECIGIEGMAEDEAVRDFRLALLAEFRALFQGIADISRIAVEREE